MNDEILIERRDGIAMVTLNRPKALNALTLGMYRTLDPDLLAWGRDPTVRCVMIRGAGGKAFCAALVEAHFEPIGRNELTFIEA